MGTDIYTHVEVMGDDGKWEEVLLRNTLSTTVCTRVSTDNAIVCDAAFPFVSAFENRDYQLFGILSNGMRNDDYRSIDDYPRGVPLDASASVREAYEGDVTWVGASWYSLKELELWCRDEDNFTHPFYDGMTGLEKERQKREDRDMLDRFKRFMHGVEFVALLKTPYGITDPSRVRVVFWFD